MFYLSHVSKYAERILHKETGASARKVCHCATALSIQGQRKLRKSLNLLHCNVSLFSESWFQIKWKIRWQLNGVRNSWFMKVYLFEVEDIDNVTEVIAISILTASKQEFTFNVIHYDRSVGRFEMFCTILNGFLSRTHLRPKKPVIKNRQF